jgi:uncharacterized membrane protein YkoI
MNFSQCCGLILANGLTISLTSECEFRKDYRMTERERIAVLALLMAFGAGTAAFAYTGQELAQKAKITLDQAREIATKARPGQITDQELEKEKGGLRYSFDIKSGKATYEVGVDAMTGEVLENAKEGPHPD